MINTIFTKILSSTGNRYKALMSKTFKFALVSGKVSIIPARLVDAAISRPVMEDKTGSQSSQHGVVATGEHGHVCHQFHYWKPFCHFNDQLLRFGA